MTTPTTALSPEMVKAFMMLVSALSPENLHCDGEISRTEAAKREKVLKARWRELERSLGRTVSEDEVWRLFLTTSRS